MAKTKTTKTRKATTKKVSARTASKTGSARAVKGRYIDGFILPLPKKNRARYKKMAELGRKVWMEHGALEYRECIGESLTVEEGMGTTFPKVSGAKSSDTVVFAWVVYKSRAHRDKVMKKVMMDPRMHPTAKDKKSPVFDMTKMAYGGFDILVSN